MSTVNESFVDLGYRGLSLGRRVKLTQLRPSTGYLEVPQPMPVGTAIAITTDEGVRFDATIAEVHEQVAGAALAPGMLVRPVLDAAEARTWWEARVQLPELPPPAPPPPPVAVAVAVAPATTVLPKRMTLQGAAAVPELVDDGRNTVVMDAVSPEIIAAAEAEAAAAAAEAASDDEAGDAPGDAPGDAAPADKAGAKTVKRRKKKR